MDTLQILEKNRSLHHRHAGQRCFLIGNGPSIAAQDLVALRHEIKICFNSFYKHPHCQEIAPDYWMAADPAIWQNKNQFLLPLLEAVESAGIVTKLFFPLWGSVKVGGSRFLDIHYFSYDQASRHLTTNIDFCTGIPPFAQNVMLVGMMLAFYLGCNPIIILGADHTWWEWTRDEYAGKETPHFFKNDYSPISKRYSFDILQSTIAVQRYQYRQLQKYAALRGFEIYNATPHSALDIFPRIDFDTLRFAAHSPYVDHGHPSCSPAPAQELGAAALGLIGAGRYVPALALIDEARRRNINRSSKVQGLDYLRSLCLAGLGENHEALIAAHQDFISNPANRGNAGNLLRALGDRSVNLAD